MATLYPYISEGAHAGQKVQLKAHKFVWVPGGEGAVATLSLFDVDIDGRVQVVVYNGNLRIHLQLLDQDPEAVSGPCMLQLNAHVDEKASYQVEDSALTVSAAIADKKATVSLSRCNDGEQTECKVTGFLDITVHLEPKAG